MCILSRKKFETLRTCQCRCESNTMLMYVLLFSQKKLNIQISMHTYLIQEDFFQLNWFYSQNFYRCKWLIEKSIHSDYWDKNILVQKSNVVEQLEHLINCNIVEVAEERRLHAKHFHFARVWVHVLTAEILLPIWPIDVVKIFGQTYNIIRRDVILCFFSFSIYWCNAYVIGV